MVLIVLAVVEWVLVYLKAVSHFLKLVVYSFSQNNNFAYRTYMQKYTTSDGIIESLLLFVRNPY